MYSWSWCSRRTRKAYDDQAARCGRTSKLTNCIVYMETDNNRKAASGFPLLWQLAAGEGQDDDDDNLKQGGASASEERCT